MGEVWVEIFVIGLHLCISPSPPVGEVWVEIEEVLYLAILYTSSPPVGEVWVEIRIWNNAVF